MTKNISLYFYYLILRFVLFVVFLTCKWKVVQKEVLLDAVKKPRPLLLCLWHEQLVYISRFFKNSSFNFYGIISTHFDAEIYSRILKAWNIKLIRGSSTRGWSNVIKKMINEGRINIKGILISENVLDLTSKNDIVEVQKYIV